LSSPLFPFLQIFALNGFEIERGEPARNIPTIFTIYPVFSIAQAVTNGKTEST
jgi:hypothetical protein